VDGRPRDIDAEVAEHRAATAELEQITSDYRRKVLHGEAGSTMRATFGSYTVYADLHRAGARTPNPGRSRGRTGSAADAGSPGHSSTTSRSAIPVRIGGAAAGTAP